MTADKHSSSNNSLAQMILSASTLIIYHQKTIKSNVLTDVITLHSVLFFLAFQQLNAYRVPPARLYDIIYSRRGSAKR